MDVYVDTKFIDDGNTLDLIALGLVRRDGLEYYAVNAEVNINKIARDDWLTRNVWPALPQIHEDSRIHAFSTLPGWSSARVVLMKRLFDKDHPEVKSRRVIAQEVASFLRHTPHPRMYGWDCAFHEVVISQLWGSRDRRPAGVPWAMTDLCQELGDAQLPILPIRLAGLHHALVDARHIRTIHRAMTERGVLHNKEYAYDTAA